MVSIVEISGRNIQAFDTTKECISVERDHFTGEPYEIRFTENLFSVFGPSIRKVEYPSDFARIEVQEGIKTRYCVVHSQYSPNLVAIDLDGLFSYYLSKTRKKALDMLFNKFASQLQSFRCHALNERSIDEIINFRQFSCLQKLCLERFKYKLFMNAFQIFGTAVKDLDILSNNDNKYGELLEEIQDNCKQLSSIRLGRSQ